MSPRRRLGWVALFGVALGAAASATAAATNVGMCEGEVDGVCLGLVRTLSLRVGLVTAGLAIVLTLMTMGLARMQAEEDRRRAHADVSD